jgi:integrase
MGVRKRKWTTRKGEQRETWILSYTGPDRRRHIETFRLKHAADARWAQIKVNMEKGAHTPVNRNETVASAGADWVTYLETEGRERTTIAAARQHLRDWIVPRLGAIKLANLNSVTINSFRDSLLKSPISRRTANKILISLKALLKDARRRGHLSSNPAEAISIKMDGRAVRKLEIGRDIPTPDEIRRIVAAAEGPARPFLIAAIFTGMRASELRGLRWSDVALSRGTITVRQRADRFGQIGMPKSKSSARTIPIGPMIQNALRDWRLACASTSGTLDLVFANKRGNPQAHGNIWVRILKPTLAAAGITNEYGLHAFRHFFCSWSINRREEGGRGLSLKQVQQLMGHSTLAMTSDTYGHLLPLNDDGAELAAAERALMEIAT